MPLIVVCGLPCSGKSKRANELKQFFLETQNKKTVLVSDDAFGSEFNKNATFSDSAKEKQLRSWLKFEAQKNLSQDVVVILDSGNYVKGYRYEAYCLSKAAKTTMCVVHCDLLPERCLELDREKEEGMQYEKEVFSGLVLRFETPDSRNRWDSPLFTIHEDETLPFTEIHKALFMTKAQPPNLSTQTQPLSSTNMLHDIHKLTQDMVKLLIEEQQTHEIGDNIVVPPAKEEIHLSSVFSAVELQKIRKDFISYTKLRSDNDPDKIPDLFVQFLNKKLSQ